MRVLTIMQPWASLVALGYKTIETRGVSTKVRGEIAIHAAASIDPRFAVEGFTRVGSTMSADIAVDSDGCGRLRILCDGHPLALDGARGYVNTTAPVGAIIAVANLHDCVPIIEWTACTTDGPAHVCAPPGDAMYVHRPIGGPISEITSETPRHIERGMGDYTPGRWAWLLSTSRTVAPVPFRGGQMWSRTWDGPT